MKNLLEISSLEELKRRMAHLRPDSPRQWGHMSPAQALAHCSIAIRMAMGEIVIPRTILGRILGRMAKKSLLVKGEPMRRNAPTHPTVLVRDERDFATELRILSGLLDRLSAGGPTLYTKHPHFFFGMLTPVEWATLQYAHLDHHLRQFGV